MQDSKPNKQHYLFKHPPKRYKDDPISSSRSKLSGPSQLRISEIRVVNDFSIDIDRSSILEQSLEQDIKQWSQTYRIDQQIVQKVEKEIKEIDNQIVQLATQFDVCLNLQQKTESKFQEFQKLLRGTQFTKFSRSNCKKSAQRLIFYCPFLEAICWKPKNSKFPTTKQIIPIDQIVQIHNSYNKYRIFRKNFTLPQNSDPECFLAIEARNGIRLELLSENRNDQQLYIKTLNMLINQDKMQNICFMEQYNMDINQIRRNLDKSKDCFLEAVDKLQQNFISTTSTLLSQEKEKTQTIKKRSQHYMFQSKMHIEDLNMENELLRKSVQELQLEKDYLSSRIEQMQEYHNQRQFQIKNSTNPQLLSILQIIKDINGLNGDQEIDNESQYEYQQTDTYQECCNSLAKLKNLYQIQQNTEMELREYINLIQQEKNIPQNNYQNLQNELQDAQVYIIELENVNQMLQQKLKTLNRDMEYKEKQFQIIIDDMQKLQEQLPTIIHNSSQSSSSEYSKLKGDNEKLKEALQRKLSDLRNQILREERNWMGIFTNILVYLCQSQHIEENDPSLCIQLLCQSIKSVELSTQIRTKTQFFIKNYKDEFERQLMDQLRTNQNVPLTPLSTQNSNQIFERTFSSPNKLFLKNQSKMFKSKLDTNQKNYLSQLVK